MNRHRKINLDLPCILAYYKLYANSPELHPSSRPRMPQAGREGQAHSLISKPVCRILCVTYTLLYIIKVFLRGCET